MRTRTVAGAQAARLFLVASALAAFPAAALADSTSADLTVEATVQANCTVSTSKLDFGTVNPLSGSNVNGTGGISVTCTNGTGWTASANIGSGSGASFSARRLTSSTGTLNYNLYTDNTYATVWGDGTGSTGTMTGTGTGSAQSRTVYGRIGSGQTTARPGSYADTVSVTISY